MQKEIKKIKYKIQMKIKSIKNWKEIFRITTNLNKFLKIKKVKKTKRRELINFQL